MDVELPDGGTDARRIPRHARHRVHAADVRAGQRAIITVLEGGKLRWFQVHDHGLYDALTAVGPQGTEEIVKLFFRGAQVLRKMATSTLGFADAQSDQGPIRAAVQSRAGYRPGSTSSAACSSISARARSSSCI
jgi:hypothetical protein